MRDLRELLPDYLLGQLSPEETHEVEAWLEASPEARAELKSLESTLFALPEELAPVNPPPRTWGEVRKHLHAKPLGRPRLLWVGGIAAAFLVLAGWGIFSFAGYRALQAEQARVAYWLALPADWRLLKNAKGEGIGSMIWTEDGGCLIVMRDPPPAGKVYQAWGTQKGRKVSLGTFRGRVYETSFLGFDRMGVSLEPPGGNPQPTEPLGSIPIQG
jgi:hypothetical protein